MLDEQALCLRCGLCCDGSLFAWVKLRSAELSSARLAGLRVYGEHPADRGFAQPCAAFSGRCEIYFSGFYPKSCSAYRCVVLKRTAAGELDEEGALAILLRAKQAAEELRVALGVKASQSLRDQIADLKPDQLDPLVKTALVEYLTLLRNAFGVDGIQDALIPEFNRT